jgi:hypothetical protein
MGGTVVFCQDLPTACGRFMRGDLQLIAINDQ